MGTKKGKGTREKPVFPDAELRSLLVRMVSVAEHMTAMERRPLPVVPAVVLRDVVELRVTLYPKGGAMVAEVGSWRPFHSDYRVDERANNFTEQFNLLIREYMEGRDPSEPRSAS